MKALVGSRLVIHRCTATVSCSDRSLGHERPIYDVRFSPESNRIAASRQPAKRKRLVLGTTQTELTLGTENIAI